MMFTLFRAVALTTLVVCPPAYFAMREAARARHYMCGPVLGTHTDDDAMRYVYPI